MRIKRIEETVETGAPLDRYGQKNWALSGYGRDDNLEYRAFFAWLQAKGNEADIKKAELELKSIQTKTLRTDSSPAGGYLVPAVMDNQIKKNVIEVSPCAGARTPAHHAVQDARHRPPFVGPDLNL